MITVEEVNSQVKSYYMPCDLDSLGWNDLSDEDKQVLVNRADAEFDTYQWIGEKVSEDQEHAFPRVVLEKTVNADKIARALAIYCVESLRVNSIENSDISTKGITSIKVEGASESYDVARINLDLYKTRHKAYLNGLTFRGGGN